MVGAERAKTFGISYAREGKWMEMIALFFLDEPMASKHYTQELTCTLVF